MIELFPKSQKSLNAGGVQTIEQVGRKLKATGNKELKKELQRGITAATKPLRQKLKAAAKADLPQRGGLAALVGGASFTASIRTSGREVGVRIIGRRKGYSLAQIDEGVIRHPVFGRDVWVEQRIKGGWFTKTAEADAPQIRRAVVDVLDDVAKKLADG